MRIVHYYPTAREDSGVTLALWAWARAQARAGVEVAVLHRGSSLGPERHLSLGDDAPVPKIAEIIVPHRGLGRLTRHPVGLGRWLRRGDILILHEGWVLSNHVAAGAARGAGIPYVVMPHGVYEPAWRSYLRPPLRLREHFERRLLERAAAVHAFFDSELPGIRHLAPSASFIVLPTGFDLPDTHWIGGGGYLSWVGRYDPWHKGLDILIDALALLPAERRPRLRLHGYDFRGGLEVLRRRIADRVIGDWVDLGGVISGPAKTEFLRHADGYVHPSRWESYGIALVENLALGVPCVVSSSVHLASHLTEYDAAILSRPDPQDLADALVRLGQNPPATGPNGRRFVGERLDWADIIPAFVASMERLAS
jgi:glycosyltransferase involved in cell wall biosynthesis